MRTIAPQNINETQVTVTSTATSLYSLIATANSATIPTTQQYYDGAGANAVWLYASNNPIRYAFGTPTTAKGTLIQTGERKLILGDLSTLKLIRTGSNSTVDIEIGVAKTDEGIFGMGNAASQSSTQTSADNSFQAAAAATGNGTAVAVSGYGGVTWEVTGTFVATITWEGSRDGGTTYYSIEATAVGGNAATTTTTTGLYTTSVKGYTHIRARVSAYTSGSVTVLGNLFVVTPLNQIHANTLATQLGALIDKISSRNEKYSYTNLTASALIRTGAGQIKGFFVASTTAGTIKLWDNTSAATTVIINTTTPVDLGWYDLGDLGFTTGLYCTLANTIDVTVVWKDNTIA